MNKTLRELLKLDLRLAVCKLRPDEILPSWAVQGAFFSVTKTSDELSIVCDEDVVPEGIKAEKGWRALRVVGSMEFGVVGVLASLTVPVAEANIGVFAISTFDTDYLLLKETDFSDAIEAQRSHGHSVEESCVFLTQPRDEPREHSPPEWH